MSISGLRWSWVVLALAVLGCSKSSAGGDAPAAASGVSSAASAPAARVAAAASGSAAAQAPARAKVTCSELLSQMEKTSKDMGIAVTTTLGSWGKVPPEVRALPPAAQHCGSISMLDQAIVASGLAGKELEGFYAPLFAKLGCQPFTCEVLSRDGMEQTRCKCRVDGAVGSVNTDASAEAYSIAFVKP